MSVLAEPVGPQTASALHPSNSLVFERFPLFERFIPADPVHKSYFNLSKIKGSDGMTGEIDR